MTNVRFDSVSIAADPSPSLAPYLAKVLTFELTPTAKINGNGSFLVAKSDRFFFSVRVMTACRSWQSDLAYLSPVSRSNDHIADSCTGTSALTICLLVSWVHIGRSTYPSQKKLRQPREAKPHRKRQPREAKLQARACSREFSPVPQR